MMKPSEWLSSHTDSHSIFDHAGLSDSFEKETGIRFIFRSHTHEQTRKNIDGRGLGGTLNMEHPERLVCYGWEVAEDLADHYGNRDYRNYTGRGFRWRAALKSIADAGE